MTGKMLDDNFYILFREENREQVEERAIAAQYFATATVREHLGGLSPGTVIARYSALPYYREVEGGINYSGHRLINSASDHEWIAEARWLDVLPDGLTSPTCSLEDFYKWQHRDSPPFILKGRTNSAKWKWATHMFAPTTKAAISMGHELSTDAFLGPQGIVVRKYIPFVTYEYGINGLPFTNEWRLFCYKDSIFACTYYWDVASDETKARAHINEEAIDFAENIAKIARDCTTFYTLDIAQAIDGKWWLVEINDGQMSGLNGLDPHVYYNSLKDCLKNES